jgi:hypothetical protein
MQRQGLRLVIMAAALGALGLAVAGPAQAGNKIAGTVALQTLTYDENTTVFALSGSVDSKKSACEEKRSLTLTNDADAVFANDKSDGHGDFTLVHNGNLPPGDYTATMAKKKLAHHKVCKPDTAVFHLAVVGVSSTSSFDQMNNFFSGNFSSEDPGCVNQRYVALRRAPENDPNAHEIQLESTTDISGHWQFNLGGPPANGWWDIVSNQIILTPGEADHSTGDLTVHICQSFDTTDQHIF